MYLETLNWQVISDSEVYTATLNLSIGHMGEKGKSTHTLTKNTHKKPHHLLQGPSNTWQKNILLSTGSRIPVHSFFNMLICNLHCMYLNKPFVSVLLWPSWLPCKYLLVASHSHPPQSQLSLLFSPLRCDQEFYKEKRMKLNFWKLDQIFFHPQVISHYDNKYVEVSIHWIIKLKEMKEVWKTFEPKTKNLM